MRSWVVVLLLLSLHLLGLAAEENWPRFRGPNGTGISPATTVPATWTKDDYTWTVDLPGMGHASPVVWGKRLFVTCGDPKSATRSILCLSTGTGRALWQRDYPSKTHRMHRDNSYATATPAVDAAGMVAVWSTPEEVALLALDNEGREVWRRGIGPYVSGHGSGASPILVDGLVVLANDQEDPRALPSMYGPNPTMEPGKSFLIALDRTTGEPRWTLDRRTHLAAYSTPCIARSLEGRPEVILSSTAHGVTGVDAATGTVNWEMADIFKDRCVGSPVLADGLAIAGYGTGTRGVRMVAVRPGSRAKGIEATLAYDLTRPVPLVPTPLVKDGRLYLWGDDGRVACLVASTGKAIWQERLPGWFYGSPVWVAGRLYCISRKGDVVVLAAADTYKLLFRLPLGDPSYATPAVASGVMYLRTQSRLFALGATRP